MEQENMLKLEVYQLAGDTFKWVPSHRPHRGQAAGDGAQYGQGPASTSRALSIIKERINLHGANSALGITLPVHTTL